MASKTLTAEFLALLYDVMTAFEALDLALRYAETKKNRAYSSLWSTFHRPRGGYNSPHGQEKLSFK